VGHGKTAGGVREFGLPNMPIVELEYLITRIIK